MRFVFAAVAGLIVAAVVFRVAVALAVPGRVTSWWRSPLKNRSVGGNPWSLHQLGLAVDVLPTAGNRAALERVRSWLPWRAVLVNEGDHLHFQVV